MTIKAFFTFIGMPLIFACIFNTLQAQTPSISQPCARVLVGIQQDSVQWSAEPCADFIAYEVYGRNNSQMPYSLLQTINDPLQLVVVQSNVGEVFWEYQIKMVCASQTYTTIAVDNQRPITPDLTRVYIANNKPVLEWQSSPSSDVIGYQIYKENPYGSGNFYPYPLLNELQTGNQFVDINATELLVRYAIVAVSPCNKSLLGEGNLDGTTGPHTSIVINNISVDACSRELTIDWNPYENWRSGVEKYEIWASINGANPSIVATTTSTSYVLFPVEDNTNMSFYIKAIELNGNGNSAVSNTKDIYIQTNRPLQFAYINSITYNADGEIDLTWKWDINADFTVGELIKNDAASLYMSSNPTQMQNAILDNNISIENPPYYQIKTTDGCGAITLSEIAKPITLKAEAQDGYLNKITWTSLTLPDFSLSEYYLYKVVGTNVQRIAILQDTFFVDEINTRQENQYEACYYVIANGSISPQNHPMVYTNSRSNTACALQNGILVFPNAFSPQGHNRYFKPAMVFGKSIENYTMQIYDRYGAIVYTSNDVYVGWNGEKDGEDLPMGVYVYLVQYTQPDGKTINEKGTVMLLR